MTWWRDLSVTKKLYAVVGVMALLIASELITLLFAMDTLSAVRSFVGGEGIWSKAQKDAVYSLHRYAYTGDERFYDQFKKRLEVNDGDHDARIALESKEFEYNKAADGFIRGGNHPDDIQGLIKLIKKFYWVSYIDRALHIWYDADMKLGEIRQAAEDLRATVRSPNRTNEKVETALLKVDRLNEELTSIEVEFSAVLGEGSRWLERILMTILILAVLTIESTGLFLTITFSRNLSRSLKEMSEAATEVGKGNFTKVVPVRSGDELGQLAAAINKMSSDLESNIFARNKAENASQVKTLFLANMSHEIRTPLGVILGLTEILKDPALPWDDHQRYVDTMEKTGRNLARLVNDILDISKVESGHVEIENANFALKPFIEEMNAMLQVQAERTGNRLKFVASGSQPIFVHSDQERLRQILVNLVNNALKYTHHGEVTVRQKTEGTQLIFEITDTGVGISEENQNKLFRVFSQAGGVVNREEGTGLGLVLSKRLAQALGGDVSLKESRVGGGSTFRVAIQNLAAENQAAESVTPVPSAACAGETSLKGKNILVVEDSPDNQLLVRLFLARQGMNVDFANNGEEGMNQALNKDYDLVLMDMQMPVMDGYLATKHLREKGYLKPIVALTAHAMSEDRERCISVGCDDYLTKPIDSSILYRTLSRHISPG